jgi:uncharacterized RDD family membrane protein YckC
MQPDPIVDLIRRRTRAGWVDVFILFVVAVVISAATGNAHVGTWTAYGPGGVAVTHHGFSINLPGATFLWWVLICLLYYSADETFTGQTVGKRMFGLKVIKVNGRPLDGTSVVIRTVGRLVDVLPAFYLVGWITMRGPRRPPQRLGDRIAGTTVVPVTHP